MSHARMVELLPWYANATLSEEERYRVEAHMANCTECARELALLRDVGSAVRDWVTAVPEPTESSLPRLLARVEPSRPPARWPTRVVRAIRGVWAETPRAMRWAFAGQLALLLVFVGLLLPGREKPTVFGTASGGSASAPAGVTIVVGFAEGVSESAMRETVRATGGRIVDGPSALGLYTVAVPLAPERPAEIDALLERLRRDPRIRLAERAI